ncbi:MAG: TonB-dependent receptor [Bacteroidota bacterium]
MSRFTRFAASMVLMFSAVTLLLAEIPTGVIKGTVTDIDTREPLLGANVLVAGTKLGAATDENGEFLIKGVPAGIRALEIRLVGYRGITLTDIAVSPDRSVTVRGELRESPLETEGVTVTAGYFRTNDVAPLGTIGFNAQEIRRSPGSANDVSRILMALPSTAAISDNANDLAVRGGSPMENGFYVDGIPIPNINHFPVQGSTGGPIGILNIDFIENADFHTSGFSAGYGNRLSSVVDIRFREGRTEGLYGKAFMSFAGFGAMAEGPLPGSSGSWLISGNKSYLDLIVEAIGTGVAPRYGDLQGKASISLGQNHRLTVMDIFGQSDIDFNKEKSIEQGQRYYGKNGNTQNTVGTSWRSIWSSGFTSNTSLSLSTARFETNFFKVNSDERALTSDNKDESLVLRSLHYLMLGKRDRLEFGLEGRYETGDFHTFWLGDTTRLGTKNPDFYVQRKIRSPKAGLFATYIMNPLDPLTISAGLRADYYELNERVQLSPRLAISYAVTDRFTLKANTGLFYQQIPLIVLSSDKRFEGLKNISAYHFGIGMDYMLTPDTKLTVEAYNKEYRDLPLDSADPTLSVVDGALFNQRFRNYQDLQNVGKAYTRGIEIIIQKKMAKDIYGLISGAYFRSRYSDLNGIWYDRVYDNQFIFSIIGGYKPEGTWEFSARWTYAGGVPYTPFDQAASTQVNLGIIDQTRINGERYPAYHSLNLRIDKKFYFDRHLLDIYLSVWNAYNRQNISGYFWNTTENRQDTQYQWSLLPIVGVEYEF